MPNIDNVLIKIDALAKAFCQIADGIQNPCLKFITFDLSSIFIRKELSRLRKLGKRIKKNPKFAMITER
jgi:hypothetical protein